MTANVKDVTEERLTLQSRLSELHQISDWIERLASRYSIPSNTRFAMNLCLEEALSNIIRHGYSGKPNLPIVVDFAMPRDGRFVFTVEDEAPPFNPLEGPDLPPLNSVDEVRIGGQGIRLLRSFADELEYWAMPSGNRLSISFFTTGPAAGKD